MLEGLFVGDGELLPALLPAAGQHTAAVRRRHPFTEAVLVLSLCA